MKIKVSFATAFVLACFHGFSQSSIALINTVKAKQVYEKEVMYFYENNWKAYRQEALKAGYISGYQLIKSRPDSTGLFSVILVTQFPDSITFRNVEENFRPIMQKLSPNGPKMLNALKRNEILQTVGSYEGKVIFEDKKKVKDSRRSSRH